MAKVVEYLGLPGVGKSWHLRPEGFCGAAGAYARPVPRGLSGQKALNTLRGISMHPVLFRLLWWSWLMNLRTMSLHRSIRPQLVVFERIGRCAKLRRVSDGDLIHVDEGALQFIWRSFLPKTVNDQNTAMLQRCVSAAPDNTSVAYVSCPEQSRHRRQIARRGKSAEFDLAVTEGDSSLYRRGRIWMAILLKALRERGFDIEYVSAGEEGGSGSESWMTTSPGR